MDAKDFIAPVSGFLGVLVGGLITVLKDVYLQWRKDRKALEYLAVMVVFALDKFVSEAATVVTDNGETDYEDGCTYTVAALPHFKPEDIKVDWTALLPDMVYQIFNLSARTEYAHGAVASAGENAGPPDYEEVFEERQMQFSELGLAADELARDLRKLASLQDRTKNPHWDPVEEMRSRRAKLIERREARAKQNSLDDLDIADSKA